jgi:hypothetical protein
MQFISMQLYRTNKPVADAPVRLRKADGKGAVMQESQTQSGQGSVAVLNTSATAQNVQVKFKNYRMGDRFYWPGQH